MALRARRIVAKVWAAAALSLGGGLLAAACGRDPCDDPINADCWEYSPCPGTCAPYVYVSWFPDVPYFYWFGKYEDRPLSCPAPHEPSILGVHVKAGARCPACRCEPTTCLNQLVFVPYSSPDCDPSSRLGDTIEVNGDACISLDRIREEGLSAVGVGYEPEECSAHPDWEETDAAFDQVVVRCATKRDVSRKWHTRDACDKTGQVCLEHARPEGFRLCLEYLGHEPPEGMTCPAPYTDKVVTYTGLQGCAPCNCEVAGSRECEITASFFQDYVCAETERVPSDDTLSNPECFVPNGGVDHLNVQTNVVREKLVTCTPTGGEQTGELVPYDEQVLCCEPLEG
jgi:hypothetical protein